MTSGNYIKFPQFRLEDLFEKSDMKMENGNMGSESSKAELTRNKKPYSVYIREAGSHTGLRSSAAPPPA